MANRVSKAPGLLMVAGGLTGGLLGRAMRRTRGSVAWGVALGALGGAAGDYMLDRLGHPRLEDSTQRFSVTDMAEYLCQHHLSPEVTAYLSGLDEPDTVEGWAQGRLLPSAEEASRLEVAYKAAQCLVDVCGDDMTRSWFFGTNRALRNTAPAYVLRHWNRKDRASVVSAAQQFAEI